MPRFAEDARAANINLIALIGGFASRKKMTRLKSRWRGYWHISRGLFLSQEQPSCTGLRKTSAEPASL
jgi:hypothetical protein